LAISADIAHPTGRLIGERDAYEVDMDEVHREARNTATALELPQLRKRLELKRR
jgi:DNA polymerase (family X)